MGEVKPWQIILIAAAVIAVGFTIWRLAFAGGPNLPDAVMVVDVKTGQLFELDISGRAAAAYPEKHPDTGEYTLLPVEQLEDGSWQITSRMRPVLEDVQGPTPAVTDPQTGTVRVSDGQARRISL